jgi:hypothetical protein
MDIKKAYNSVSTEALYNTVIKLNIPLKLVRLIKMYLNETYRQLQIDNASDAFPIQNNLI